MAEDDCGYSENVLVLSPEKVMPIQPPVYIIQNKVGVRKWDGEGMTTHSTILAWEIHAQSLAGYSPQGRES